MYYGLMRISEVALTEGGHAIKSRDVQIADNKDKILLTLRTSKTHGVNNYPQRIKIETLDHDRELCHTFFCPFTAARNYMTIRGRGYWNPKDHFFVFRNGSFVTDEHVRTTMRLLLKSMNLNEMLYDTHSYRIGRTIDLYKMGYSFLEIREKGRWKSNVVFQYLRQC